MHDILKQALEDAEIEVNRNALNEAQIFIETHDLKPTYADVWRYGDMALFWHKKNYVAGLLFDGNGNLIWNWYNKNTDDRNQGTMSINNFIGSKVHKFIADNFA